MTVPDSSATRRSWIIPLAALALGTFAIGTSEFVMMGILPVVSHYFSVTESAAGILVTAYAIGVAVGAPALVVLLVRIRRVTALALLLASFCVTHVFAAIAPNFGTLIVARFLGGLPHGAYFGLAAVVGASVVPKARQGLAIATVLLGLTAANVIGVPAGTWLGQTFGWRATFVGVAVIGGVALIAVLTSITIDAHQRLPSLRDEIHGLLNRNSILTIITVAIGFAGLFSAYAYIGPLVTDIAGFDKSSIPWVLSLIGVGFTLGNIVGGWVTDRSVGWALFGGLTLLAIALALLPLLAADKVGLLIVMFVIGFASFGAEPPIQKRLIDQAPHAPTLASATNQSSFNIANALGAGIAGIAISEGMGVANVGYIGATFVAVGIACAAYSFIQERKEFTETVRAG